LNQDVYQNDKLIISL